MRSEDAFVAVIEVNSLVRDASGQLVPCRKRDRIGPYDMASTAKGIVTTLCRQYSSADNFHGWVEVSTGWKVLDG